MELEQNICTQLRKKTQSPGRKRLTKDLTRLESAAFPLDYKNLIRFKIRQVKTSEFENIHPSETEPSIFAINTSKQLSQKAEQWWA